MLPADPIQIRLRRHVTSRLDATGRPYVENGMWQMALEACDRVEALTQALTTAITRLESAHADKVYVAQGYTKADLARDLRAVLNADEPTE